MIESADGRDELLLIRGVSRLHRVEFGMSCDPLYRSRMSRSSSLPHANRSKILSVMLPL